MCIRDSRLGVQASSALPVIWIIFLWAFLFSLPGAWLGRHQSNFSLKIVINIIAISAVSLLGNYSTCMALEQASPTIFILVNRLEIIITMLLSWLFLKEVINTRVWISVFVIVFGFIVMKLDHFSLDLQYWSPILWGLTSALSFATMQVLAKRIIHEINPQVLNLWRLAFALLLLWNFEEVRSGVLNLQISEWKWLALAAFCGPFMGRVTYTYSLRYITISKAVIVGSFSPAATLLMEFMVFGTLISGFEALGGVIMLGGIMWAFWPGLKLNSDT